MAESTPRERRHARTKQSILKAARSIIVNQGVQALSMRKLARLIDYSPSGLYKFFGSKEELIDEIRGEAFDRLLAHLTNSVQQHQTARHKVTEAMLAYLDFADDNPELYLLLFTVSPSSIAPEHITGDAIFNFIGHILTQGLASGELKLRGDYDPVSFIYHGWVTIHGIAMLRLSLFKTIRQDFDGLSRPIVESIFDSYMSS